MVLQLITVVGQGNPFWIIQNFCDLQKCDLSSNLTIFDHTETRFEHESSKLVKYKGKVMVIGGFQGAWVEEIDTKQLSWKENSMSPVNGYSRIEGFTALSINQSLFLFGRFH